MGNSAGLLLTCEHASAALPAEFLPLFADTEPGFLSSHRAYDAGAADVTQDLSRQLGVDAHYGSMSRLVVDLNRSPASRNVFSRWSRELPAARKEELLATVHAPFRQAARTQAGWLLKNLPRIVHLSVHSFTPVLDGEVRTCEIGLLYDPARQAESRLAARWAALLQQQRPDWRIRKNYPYRGVSDGHVTALRKEWPNPVYTGLELEINQSLVENTGRWQEARQAICATFAAAFAAS